MVKLLTLAAVILASLAALGWLAYAVLLRYPNISKWVSSLGNPSDPTTEVKLVAFGSGTVAAIGWLSYSLVESKGVITGEWNSALVTFCLLIGLGATVEALSKRKGGD